MAKLTTTEIYGDITVHGSIITDSNNLKIRDYGNTYYLSINSNSTPDLTADKNLTFDVGNADRNVGIFGDLTIGTSVNTGAITITSNSTTARSLTLEASTTLKALTSGYALYASASNTINSEQYLSVSRGGTGLSGSSAANGSLLIGNGSGYTLTTLTGTSNQVNVTNASGSITLSLPQSIDTSATVQFGQVNIGGSGMTSASVPLGIMGSILLGNGASRSLTIAGTAAGTAGNQLEISAGSTTAGTANISGGALVISSGQSTGNGTSNIYFKTATVGTAGATTLNSLISRVVIFWVLVSTRQI